MTTESLSFKILWQDIKFINRSGIPIPNILKNLMSCCGFFKNKDPGVIIKFPNRMFEYYFSKGFTYFYCTIINLEKLPSEVKQRIHAEDIDNSTHPSV